MNRYKKEGIESYKNGCVILKRLENGTQIDVVVILTTEIDEYSSICVNKHNEYIKQKGLIVEYTDSKDSIDEATTELSIVSEACNKRPEITCVNLKVLRSIVIEDNCCRNVAKFVLSNLPSLISVTIGMNSFTGIPNSGGYDSEKEFSISNCESLTQISIGCFSFSDYASFKLEGLDSLKRLSIGDSKRQSCNFYKASFKLIGRIIELTRGVGLKSLLVIWLGGESFRYSTTTVIESTREGLCLL